MNIWCIGLFFCVAVFVCQSVFAQQAQQTPQTSVPELRNIGYALRCADGYISPMRYSLKKRGINIKTGQFTIDHAAEDLKKEISRVTTHWNSSVDETLLFIRRIEWRRDFRVVLGNVNLPETIDDCLVVPVWIRVPYHPTESSSSVVVGRPDILAQLSSMDVLLLSLPYDLRSGKVPLQSMLRTDVNALPEIWKSVLTADPKAPLELAQGTGYSCAYTQELMCRTLQSKLVIRPIAFGEIYTDRSGYNSTQKMRIHYPRQINRDFTFYDNGNIATIDVDSARPGSCEECRWDGDINKVFVRHQLRDASNHYSGNWSDGYYHMMRDGWLRGRKKIFFGFDGNSIRFEAANTAVVEGNYRVAGVFMRSYIIPQLNLNVSGKTIAVGSPFVFDVATNRLISGTVPEPSSAQRRPLDASEFCPGPIVANLDGSIKIAVYQNQNYSQSTPCFSREVRVHERGSVQVIRAPGSDSLHVAWFARGTGGINQTVDASTLFNGFEPSSANSIRVIPILTADYAPDQCVRFEKKLANKPVQAVISQNCPNASLLVSWR